MTPDEIEALDARASTFMKRGMALVTERTAPALREALDCFAQAITLREQIPLDAMPGHRYGLAAGWMNRAEAFTALGDPDSRQHAVDAYDRALDILAPLSLSNWRVRHRAIVAHQNRGLALLAVDRPDDAVEALQSAAAIVGDTTTDWPAEVTDMRAAVWSNLGKAWLESDGLDAAQEARLAARRALSAIDAARVETDVDIAAAALMARHVWCRAIARMLSEDTAMDETAHRSLVHEATDAVDEGLAIARVWEERGVDRFRTVATDLVRFGIRVYQRYQPQFFDEFVSENFAPTGAASAWLGSADMRAAALESLWLSFQIPRNR